MHVCVHTSASADVHRGHRHQITRDAVVGMFQSHSGWHWLRALLFPLGTSEMQARHTGQVGRLQGGEEMHRHQQGAFTRSPALCLINKSLSDSKLSKRKGFKGYLWGEGVVFQSGAFHKPNLLPKSLSCPHETDSALSWRQTPSSAESGSDLTRGSHLAFGW